MCAQSSSSPGIEDPSQIRKDIQHLIDNEALDIAFQPIVNLPTGEIIGYEALSRPTSESRFSNPAQLFVDADLADMLPQLESFIRRKTFAATSEKLPVDAMLFLNNSPSVFNSDGYVEQIEADIKSVSNLSPRRVVLEITERAEHDFDADLDVRAFALREIGFQIALDDVGAGVSGLNRIMSLRPNWLKLDLELIRDIDRDPFKQNLIRFFVRFAKLSNMKLIGEGVESDNELAMMIDLGVAHAQGYRLCKPDFEVRQLDEITTQYVVSLSRESDKRRFEDVATVQMGDLASPIMRCDQSQSISEIYDKVSCYEHCAGVVVMDQLQFAGWISRDQLESLYNKEQGETQVGSHKLENCPIIASDITLAEAMEIAAFRADEQSIPYLLVEHNELIDGVVTLRQLLVAAARAHQHAPAHTAPLTGLPNRVRADGWISQGIKVGDKSNIIFIDLRDFDAYNRSYGFEMGDVMLRRLVGLVRAHFVGPQNNASYFAHLGEDRFFLAVKDDVKGKLQQFIRAFEELHGEFFSPMDHASQAFWYVDSVGTKQSLPLTTLRVIYLPNALKSVRDSRELYETATRLRMSMHDGPTHVNKIIVDDRQEPFARQISA
ncbi:MAG: EAL domain-containing protein [Planctomycetes bacterium]|nr:EAL domain-containing protein [Planctomycetota bacterium]